MSLRAKSYLVLFVSIFYITSLFSAPMQDLIFSIDSQWHIDYEEHQGPYGLIEMTVEGETVYNWSELVSIHKLPGGQLSREELKSYYQMAVELIQGDTPSHLFGSRLISVDANSHFF